MSTAAKIGPGGFLVRHLIVYGHVRLANELNNCAILLFSQFFIGSRTSASKTAQATPVIPLYFPISADQPYSWMKSHSGRTTTGFH